MNSLDVRVAEVIANLGERTDTELVVTIKDILTAVATGTPIEGLNDRYKILYSELENRATYSGQNNFRDLWDFYNYWKNNNLDTYASRRSYVSGLYSPTQRSSNDWVEFHPSVVQVAQSRFESKHYADAVEAAFKELNYRIKEEYRQRTGVVLDGVKLMNTAFSPDKPIIVLEDITTDDGKEIQRGYMMIYAGSMAAIRNPKAHANLVIEPKEAVSLLHTASHLFYKFESAVTRDKAEEIKRLMSSDKTSVYIHVKNPDDTILLLGIKAITNKYWGKKAIILVLGDNKKSAIRLPNGVSTSGSLVDELSTLLGPENVIVR